MQGRGAVARVAATARASQWRRRAAAPRPSAGPGTSNVTSTHSCGPVGVQVAVGRACRAWRTGARCSGPAGRSAGCSRWWSRRRRSTTRRTSRPRSPRRSSPPRRGDGRADDRRDTPGTAARHTWNSRPRGGGPPTVSASFPDPSPMKMCRPDSALVDHVAEGFPRVSSEAEHDRPGRCRRGPGAPSLAQVPRAHATSARPSRRGLRNARPRMAATRVPRDGGHAPARRAARHRRPRGAVRFLSAGSCKVVVPWRKL